MRFTSQTSSDGVTEQLFTLTFASGAIPGVLWTPEGAAGTRPLVLMGHGGGQHKKAPGIAARARRFVAERGFAVVAVDAPGHGDRPRNEDHDRIIAEMRTRAQTGGELTPLIAGLRTLLVGQTVPEWRAVLDAVQELEYVGASPVGYWGVSMGCALGVPFIAAEPRIRAAVLGLNGA
jgi:dienelactone hydrolase